MQEMKRFEVNVGDAEKPDDVVKVIVNAADETSAAYLAGVALMSVVTFSLDQSDVVDTTTGDSVKGFEVFNGTVVTVNAG